MHYEVNIKIGMYKSSGTSHMDYADFLKRFSANPVVYLRFYVMLPTMSLPTLESIDALDFSTPGSRGNKIFLSTRKVRDRLHWQLLFVTAKTLLTPEINKYNGDARPGVVHKESHAQQYRVSFNPAHKGYIQRAYQTFSGYEPFTHRAVSVPFQLRKLENGGVLAIAAEPIKTFIENAVDIRTQHPHLSVHQLPLKKYNAPVILEKKIEEQHSETQEKESDEQLSEPQQKETKNELEEKAPVNFPTPVAEKPVPFDPAILEEGPFLLEELNKWLEKVATTSHWKPDVTIIIAHDGTVKLRLTLRYH